MKKISSFSLAILLTIICGIFTSCRDFKPIGMHEVPDAAKATNLKAEVNGLNVDLSWTLPEGDIKGVHLITNANNANPILLEGKATSYTVKGQPMGEECLYTIKVVYVGDYTSEGVSVKVTLPKVDLPNVNNLKAATQGRSVTLSWDLPNHSGITGIKVDRINGAETTTYTYDEAISTCTLKSQPMDVDLKYVVSVVYDTYYASEGVAADLRIPYITPKMAYLMTAASIAELPDDDERAAATWFIAQENAELIWPEQIADLDADLYPVIWIAIDRVGQPWGWENLPVSDAATLDALRQYSANGGSLFLSNMATMLTVPLGFVPDEMQPTVYGNGDGGSGDDVWVINPQLGWMFREGGDQGYYDRKDHPVYNGLTFEDPNNYGYPNLPLIGPGQREDHNCLWDCNIYGKGAQIDVIKNFEVTTNSLVLATWGHVQDHCVAGLVDFYANAEHGRCIAMGLAAYEWNQNSGTNPYQGNIEKLTKNILDYLK
ncbi:MAG: DUF4960 domain-containing protein [Muribaculaceae bacterium]|nr:DUF4960 domain-containing protein [Muribaculaceae bacterium]